MSKTFRSWDVDPLIQRIQNISEPPGVTAAIEAFIEGKRRMAERSRVATVPDAAVVIQERPTVASDTVAMETAASETQVATTAGNLSECEEESTEAGAAASSDDPSASTLSMSDEPQSPLSRRARKLHQRRMHQAAHREARKKAQ